MVSSRQIVVAAVLLVALSSANAFHVPAVPLVGRAPAASLAARMRPSAACVEGRRAHAGALMMTLAKEEKVSTDKVSEAEETAKKIADPTSSDISKLNLGMANMLDELEDMRTGDVVKAWKGSTLETLGKSSICKI